MKPKHYILTLILSILAAAGVNKVMAGDMFVGVSYGTINSTSDFTGVNGIIGYQFHEFLGAECRALFSSSSESYGEYSSEIDSLWGCYASAALPIEESTYAYVIYGHTEGDIAYSGPDTYSHKLTSSSLGFGIRYYPLEQYTIFAEYLEQADEEETFQVGFRLNF